MSKPLPPTQVEVLNFMSYACLSLEHARYRGHYVEVYLSLKEEFFRRFQRGFVFSTRWNGEFFTLALPHVENRRPLVSTERNEEGRLEPLGEWDENFNRWLASLR